MEIFPPTLDEYFCQCLIGHVGPCRLHKHFDVDLHTNDHGMRISLQLSSYIATPVYDYFKLSSFPSSCHMTQPFFHNVPPSRIHCLFHLSDDICLSKSRCQNTMLRNNITSLIAPYQSITLRFMYISNHTTSSHTQMLHDPLLIHFSHLCLSSCSSQIYPS